MDIVKCHLNSPSAKGLLLQLQKGLVKVKFQLSGNFSDFHSYIELLAEDGSLPRKAQSSSD